jgi:hypothetical protein
LEEDRQTILGAGKPYMEKELKQSNGLEWEEK